MASFMLHSSLIISTWLMSCLSQVYIRWRKNGIRDKYLIGIPLPNLGKDRKDTPFRENKNYLYIGLSMVWRSVPQRPVLKAWSSAHGAIGRTQNVEDMEPRCSGHMETHPWRRYWTAFSLLFLYFVPIRWAAISTTCPRHCLPQIQMQQRQATMSWKLWNHGPKWNFPPYTLNISGILLL